MAGQLAGARRSRTRCARARGAVLDAAGRDAAGGAPEVTLAERYRLLRELPGDRTRDHRAWDVVLDRPVRVRTLPAGDPRAVDFLDAARRTTLLDDARVPRVLDAGTEGGGDAALAWVVEEEVPGRPLTDLLADGPLSPARVRALVGEVASTLDAAARRGLHHTRLTPDLVVLGADGVVRVRGTGLGPALEVDPPQVSAARAAALAGRSDARALAGLVYAGLTGYWPRPDGDPPRAGLRTAPTRDGAPVPPRDLRPDVPADLDALCRRALAPRGDGDGDGGDGGDGGGVAAPGPRDAAELALQLAPWSMDSWSEVVRAMRGEDAAAQVRSRLQNREEVVPEAEPPVPFAAPRSTGRPERHDARFVLALVAGVLVVGLLLAVWQLTRIDVPVPDLSSRRAAPATSAAPPSAAPSAAPSASGSTTPAAAPAGPLPVAGVTAIDPEGDGSAPAGAERAVDGDPATAWRTERYASTAFGGLKSGTGLVVDLGTPAAVTSVTLDDGGEGGSVELRTAPGPSLDASAVVATAPAGGRQVLAPPAPVTTRYLVLWFTELPTTDGEPRAVVGEVGVTGSPAPAP